MKAFDFKIFAFITAVLLIAPWGVIADQMVRPDQYFGMSFEMQLVGEQVFKVDKDVTVSAGADDLFSFVNEKTEERVDALLVHPTGLYAIDEVLLERGEWRVVGDAKVFIAAQEVTEVVVYKSSTETTEGMIKSARWMLYLWITFISMYAYVAMRR